MLGAQSSQPTYFKNKMFLQNKVSYKSLCKFREFKAVRPKTVCEDR